MAKAVRRNRSQTEAIQTVPDRLPAPPEPGDSADRAQQSEPITNPFPSEATSMGSEPSEDDIRLRAYQRFLHRGGQHGHHEDDWLEAESELRKK